jgi:signal peptidase I
MLAHCSMEDTKTPHSQSHPPHSHEKPQNALIEIVKLSLIALIIVFPVRFFIAQPFIVSGASMEPTFHNGQYLIIDQLSYRFEKPTRGEVIIFKYPKDPSKYFIKRVIGLPGETISIDGNVVTVVNAQNEKGFILDEPYVPAMSPNTSITETLGEHEYFVMGDNRDQSSDSRVWGVLRDDLIVGRAFLRLFPVSQAEFMPGGLEDFTGEANK